MKTSIDEMGTIYNIYSLTEEEFNSLAGKAEKWDKLDKCGFGKAWQEAQQEIKQLKEDLENTINQLTLRNDSVDNLKEKLEKMGKELQKEIDEETKHLNHPKQIYRSVQHNCGYNLRVCEILKAILGEKK